jgi:hypothetical protein
LRVRAIRASNCVAVPLHENADHPIAFRVIAAIFIEFAGLFEAFLGNPRKNGREDCVHPFTPYKGSELHERLSDFAEFVFTRLA